MREKSWVRRARESFQVCGLGQADLHVSRRQQALALRAFLASTFGLNLVLELLPATSDPYERNLGFAVM